MNTLKLIALAGILALLFYSCKSTKSIKSKNIDNEGVPALLVEYSYEISMGDTFQASIKNQSNDTLVILYPVLKNIETKVGNDWRKVKIIYCPCGANCEPPLREKLFLPGEIHEIEWNLTESWCGEKQENGIPERIETKSKPGLFRFSINYKSGNETLEKLVKEFTIIEN